MTSGLAGESIGAWPSYRIAQAGIGLVPEMRQIFPTLTVRENLVATSRVPKPRPDAPWLLERVYSLFPRLAERERHLGNQLSGGEQQMLAIGRALLTNPTLLVLDEATEGLAPLVRAEIWRCLAQLKAEGLTLLVIDKNIGPLAAPGRPPLHRREGPHRVARRLRRAARGPGDPAPVRRRLTRAAGHAATTEGRSDAKGDRRREAGPLHPRARTRPPPR